MNAYLVMEYFLKMDDTFRNFRNKLAKVFIQNSYTHDKTCGSTGNTIKRKMSHILKTAPNHAIHYG